MPRGSSWDRALEEMAMGARYRRRQIRWTLTGMLLASLAVGAFTWYVWPGHRDTVRCRCTCPEQP